MGKLAPVVLISLHVAQSAGFAPCLPAAFAQVASARRPLLTTSFHARPREHGGARHLRATLSRDAAQVRAVVEPVPSRGMAALHRRLHVLINELIMLASLVFASLPAAVLSGLLVFSAAPSLAFADQVANPRVHLEKMVVTTVADAAAAAGSGNRAMKIVTIASAGSLALHTLLSYRIFEAQTRRPDF